jgi:hypothetical protein
MKKIAIIATILVLFFACTSYFIFSGSEKINQQNNSYTSLSDNGKFLEARDRLYEKIDAMDKYYLEAGNEMKSRDSVSNNIHALNRYWKELNELPTPNFENISVKKDVDEAKQTIAYAYLRRIDGLLLYEKWRQSPLLGIDQESVDKVIKDFSNYLRLGIAELNLAGRTLGVKEIDDRFAEVTNLLEKAHTENSNRNYSSSVTSAQTRSANKESNDETFREYDTIRKSLPSEKVYTDESLKRYEKGQKFTR